jgi:hypothetical protein
MRLLHQFFIGIKFDVTVDAVDKLAIFCPCLSIAIVVRRRQTRDTESGFCRTRRLLHHFFRRCRCHCVCCWGIRNCLFSSSSSSSDDCIRLVMSRRFAPNWSWPMKSCFGQRPRSRLPDDAGRIDFWVKQPPSFFLPLRYCSQKGFCNDTKTITMLGKLYQSYIAAGKKQLH